MSENLIIEVAVQVEAAEEATMMTTRATATTAEEEVGAETRAAVENRAAEVEGEAAITNPNGNVNIA